MGIWKSAWEWLSGIVRRNRRHILNWVDKQFDHWIDKAVARFYESKPEMRQHDWIIQQFVSFAKDKNNRLTEWIFDRTF